MAEGNSNARLRLFALLLRYSHDLFATDDLGAAATAAVNNAHELVPFETSSLFECTDGAIRLLAQYAQPVVNEHAALVVEQRQQLYDWLKQENPTPGEGLTRFIRLPLPKCAMESHVDFVWIVTFSQEQPPTINDVLKLIASSAGEALAYHRLAKPRRFHLFRKIRKSTFWSFVGALLIGSLFIRVPESLSTEFFVRAPQETTVYAWYDGAIATCLKKDGDRVKAGDVVIQYDVSQVKYKLALAKSQLAETEAELALVRQNAFAHSEELGKAKLLEIRCDGLKVSVEEAYWYLDHAQVRAPADGVVAINDGDSARLENKAVRTGDELFRVLGGEGYEVEIPVNEREASVLRGDMKATLFLHTAPETAIPARIVSVSHTPQLTDQKAWMYRVRAALEPGAVTGELRYGMRGVAKLQSGEVSLGYRMFKSAVLYLRGL